MTGATTSPAPERHRIWYQIAVLVAVSAAMVYVGRALSQKIDAYIPEARVVPSTFNEKPSGYAGLYELVARVGLEAERWRHPYRKLKDIRGTLVIVQPKASLRDFEIDQILAWVHEGNSLVLLDSFPYGPERQLPARIGLSIVGSRVLTDKWVNVDRPEGVLSHVHGLVVSADQRIHGGTPLVADAGGPIVAEVAWGGGRVLVASAPSLGANRLLSDQSAWGNFQLIVNWLAARGRPVWFDEFCHGFAQSTNVFVYLAQGPVGPIAVQLLCLAALAVASAAQRLGAPEAVENRRKISSLEYIAGMANTYRRARAYKLAWQILSHDFMCRLAATLGLSPHEERGRLVAAWAERTGGKHIHLESLLERADAASTRREIFADELVALVDACDKIADECSQPAVYGASDRE